ncbi:MAG: polymer-forming cytoskeletal protein [Motiliproteus sp.]
MSLVGKLHIDGIFEGRISSVDSIAIGRRGEVTGMIRAQQVSVSGRLDGEVHCDELTIERGGQVRGVVHSRQMTIHKDGNFIGERASTDNLPASKAVLETIDKKTAPDASLIELDSDTPTVVDAKKSDFGIVDESAEESPDQPAASNQSRDTHKPEQLTRMLDEMLGEIPKVGSPKDTNSDS